jgi:ribosomal protein L12E/L44/L45/RPP1/RPP2
MIKRILKKIAGKLVMTPESDPQAAAAEDQADMARDEKRKKKENKRKIPTGRRGL